MNPRKRLRLRVINSQGTSRIHRAALNMLKEIGMNVLDDDTRKWLKEKGCQESDDGYLLFDDQIVQRALSTVPSHMVLYDRNGNVAVDTGDVIPRFCPGINCTDVLDHRTGEIRPCLLDDISKTARVCQKLTHIDVIGNLGNPSDIAFEEQAFSAVRVLVENSIKPLPFIAHDDIEAFRIWEYLSEVAGGWESLSAKPFAFDLTGPTSPFILKKEACHRLRFAARNCLPVVCYPALFPGVTGPMTLAGAIAQSAAEILAGIVIHQLERPGSPVISGSAIIPMDMRTVNLSYGSPEYILVGLGAVDYFSDIGVPTWIGAGCTDVHTFDSQAASEVGMNILTAVLSGTPFIHNLGYLSSGKTGSLEMLVLSDEIAGMSYRIAQGIPVDDDSLGVDVSLDAGKTGKYLTHPHTKKHVRTEMWIPSLFQRFDRGDWRQSGSKTLVERIGEKLRDLLNE
jgi:trimethylamine--corrinoid protein Co-methyltransferase